MKLQKIFENEFKQLKLVRIRLKSDPANNKLPYEGYILRENEDGTMEIMIMSPNALASNMAVQPCDIDNKNSVTNVDKLKSIIADCIEDQSILELIEFLTDVSDIDSMLIANGVSYEDLYSIYKRYYLESGKEI